MTHEVIIPGRSAPQGQITLELRNATNHRLRKRVKVENAVMDWWKNAVPVNGGRGPMTAAFYNISIGQQLGASEGLSPLAAAAADAAPDFNYPWWRFLNAQLNAWCGYLPQAGVEWLWATPSAAAVDTTKLHIPTTDPLGEVTAGAMVRQPFAADGIQIKRGSVNFGLSALTWDQQRIVVDFSTTQGNGVYRSLGLGGLQSQELAPGGLRASRPPADTVPLQTSNSNAFVRQFFVATYRMKPARPGVAEMYATPTNTGALAYWDLTDATTPPTNYSGLASNVPGSGVTSFVDTPSDFWVLRSGTTLYRCPNRPPGSLTPSNTYDLSVTITAGDNDITFDGTNLYIADATQVHIVNPVTGAVTSSWAHGLTATGPFISIAWEPVEQLLHLALQSQAAGVDSGWGRAVAGQFSFRAEPDSSVVSMFTAAGSKVNAYMGMHRSAITDEQWPRAQVSAFIEGSPFGLRTAQADFSQVQFGLNSPSMASHALLNADLVKTSDDTLTITYDFNYS